MKMTMSKNSHSAFDEFRNDDNDNNEYEQRAVNEQVAITMTMMMSPNRNSGYGNEGGMWQ